MKIDLKSQNLIDKHSKRLLSALRVICNCYDNKEEDPEKVYKFSSILLYYILFVLLTEDLKLQQNKLFTEYLLSSLDYNSNNNFSYLTKFNELLKNQCYNICQSPIFKNVSLNLNSFEFSLEDLRYLTRYILFDQNGSRILLSSLELEFLNYFYEIILQFTLQKTTNDVEIIHKTAYETYQYLEISDNGQLKLIPTDDKEIIYDGQWIIQKNSSKKQSSGVFYTPPKIVDYIIEKSLSKYSLLNGLKIIDPACGCGSFLINTYFYLSDKGIKPIDIINNYIYGMDIDPISVEITKLILTLASGYYSKNIHCIDSLIIEDLPFDKNTFDIVIGNPPYINIERINKEKKKYYLNKYKSSVRRFDLYILFIELAIKVLLKKNGTLGFIIPDKFLTQSYAKGIREIILNTCNIKEIVDIKHNNIFKGANVIPIILLCDMNIQKDNYVKIVTFKNDIITQNELNQEEYKKTFNFIFRLNLNDKKNKILNLVQTKSIPISKTCYISWGLQPGNTKKFIFNEKDITKSNMYKNHPSLKNFIRGRNISTYNINYTNDKVLYITEGNEKLHRPAFSKLFETEKIVIPEVSGSKGIIAALDKNYYYTNHSVINVIMKRELITVDKSVLKARGIKLDLTKSNQEPILWQIDKDKGAYTRSTTVYRTDRDSLINIRYILALINSKLIRFYYNNFLTGELNVFPEHIKRLPYFEISLDKENYQGLNIENINITQEFNKLTKVQLHDLIVKLTVKVEKSPQQEKLFYMNLIDKAVYYLYELDNDEIQIIENSLIH